ncbi:MAG: methyltransferase domain-containing protein [Actinomycetota bacterium]
MTGRSWWEERALPRIIDTVLGTGEFARVRAEVCAGLRGDVLELGFGSGPNLPHLPDAVTGVWAVEPSDGARRLATARVRVCTLPVFTVALDGVRLPLPDGRFDAALSTMTLCTIPDVGAALAEVRRVLKPGAELHFAEHGRAEDPTTVRRQRRLTPLQRRVAGGCHLDRPIDAIVTAAGFEITELRRFRLDGPAVFGSMYLGRARVPGRYAPDSPEG